MDINKRNLEETKARGEKGKDQEENATMGVEK